LGDSLDPAQEELCHELGCRLHNLAGANVAEGDLGRDGLESPPRGGLTHNSTEDLAGWDSGHYYFSEDVPLWGHWEEW
jgi:hypothetical protein